MTFTYVAILVFIAAVLASIVYVSFSNRAKEVSKSILEPTFMHGEIKFSDGKCWDFYGNFAFEDGDEWDAELVLAPHGSLERNKDLNVRGMFVDLQTWFQNNRDVDAYYAARTS